MQDFANFYPERGYVQRHGVKGERRRRIKRQKRDASSPSRGDQHAKAPKRRTPQGNAAQHEKTAQQGSAAILTLTTSRAPRTQGRHRVQSNSGEKAPNFQLCREVRAGQHALRYNVAESEWRRRARSTQPATTARRRCPRITKGVSHGIRLQAHLRGS